MDLRRRCTFGRKFFRKFFRKRVKISYGTIVELIEKCDFRILDGIDYFEFVN